VDNIIFAFCFCFSSSLLTCIFCASPNNPLWIYFSNFLVFVISSRSLRSWELKGGGGRGVEAWRAGLGPALLPEREEEQAKGGGKGGE
jgi:hypothetical protein